MAGLLCRLILVLGLVNLCGLGTALQADTPWPREVSTAQGALTIAAPPQRIVSTAPSLTGILLAINAPLHASAAAVIGPLTDDRGFFRQWSDIARQRDVAVLYPNLAFDIEAVILAEPDLVVASATGGDSILPYVAELRAQGLQVLVLDYSSGDWQQLARVLGEATGHEAEAEAAIADFDAQAARARAELQIPDGRVSIVSYNFAGTYSVSKPGSAQARVLSALGFRVAGIPETMRGQITRGADFDFVSRENLPAAITGDGVFLLNGTEASVANFVADPVLANLPAIKAGRVWPLGPTSFRVDYYSGLEIIATIAPFFRK